MENKQVSEPLAVRIKEARIANGLTITELADKIEVSKQIISKYELGQAKPSLDIFDRLVLALGFPEDFYLKDDKIIPQSEGPLYFRSLKSADRKNRDICRIRAEWANKLITFVGQYINYPELNLPDISDELIKDEYTLDDIEKITSLLRDYWGIGDGPIDDLTYLLEKNGFIVTQIKINDTKIDAFSRWIGDRPVIFLGSDKECSARERFSEAHELGHKILHRYVHEEMLKDPKILKRIETEAHMFAASFLLPKDSFGDEVMSTSLDYFIILKRRWKVSIQAMIYRCHDLGYLSDDQTLYLRKKISKLGYRNHEPLDNELKVEEPVMLRQAIRMLLKGDVLTRKQIREILNIPINILEELLNLDEGELIDKKNSKAPLSSLKVIRSNRDSC